MATQDIRIKVKADTTKAQSSFGKLTKSVGGTKTAAIAAAAAVTTLGFATTALVKTFIDAASTSEQYRIRLNSLLGGVSEGNRLFKDMSKFAGSVAFEYENVMGAATQLSGVMKGGVDEINMWMPLIADLAAVSGLGIEETTEQVARMYTVGAQSAERFKERGINAMLGFQAGVSFTAEETRRQLIEAWEDPASKFKDASKDLADTWEGQMSMMSDKWFQFRNIIADTGAYDSLKDALKGINEELDNLIKSTNDWLVDNPDAIPDAIDDIVKSTKEWVEWLVLVNREWDKLKFQNVLDLPPGVQRILDNQNVPDIDPADFPIASGNIRGEDGVAGPGDGISEADINAAQQLADFQIENLTTLNDTKFELLLGYKEAELALTQETQDQIDEVVKTGASNEIAWRKQASDIEMSQRLAVANSAISLLGIMGEKSKAAAVAGIALSTAVNAVMAWQSTLVGANAAYAALAPIPIIGPALGEAERARVLLWGKANVGLILASGALRAGGALSGGGGGGGSSSTPSGSSISQPTVTQPSQVEAGRNAQINIEVHGNIVDHAAFVREISEFIGEAEGDNIVFISEDDA